MIGPISFENWKEFNNKSPCKNYFKYHLYSDAKLIGKIDFELGPYKLLKSKPITDTYSFATVLDLNIGNYLKIKLPDDLPKKSEFDRYHGGTLCDEIAALLSLCFGIRLKAGSSIGLSPCTDYAVPHFEATGIGVNKRRPIMLEPSHGLLILPKVIGKHRTKNINLIMTLSQISPKDASSLIRAARLYQDAIWIAESQPELSWLMLVSAIEIAANRWFKGKLSSVDLLKYFEENFVKDLSDKGGEEIVKLVADKLYDTMKVKKKFIEYIIKHKVRHPQKRPAAKHQVSWKKKDIEQSLEILYDLRSKALHEGIPFPKPMCRPPHPSEGAYYEKPEGVVSATAVWLSKDLPMLLHIFEYIVRNALLKWWNSLLKIG